MEKITPAYAAKSSGHYSPGIMSRGMLYISGQLPIDPDTRRMAGDTIEDHARQALANVDRVLAEAGLTRDRVVQCRVYITDPAHWDAVNRVFAEFFGAHKPARAVVPVSALHFGCLVEIEAIAEA